MHIMRIARSGFQGRWRWFGCAHESAVSCSPSGKRPKLTEQI